ncbi:MAG: 30S ribosomal protein S1 [SAR324 cluster bacterium]|uniref:30S ribosomal protein S1 n=1 Tax=SAR324 cluster bacterium TaxID=2024889 RepID=A0A7X9IMT8_9DELT|nr:30S ribosomal protein S1 [SAR324 cluster bacterium]
MKIWQHVEDIFAENGTIEGRVVQKVKGGLQVDIGVPAFLPGSQIDIRPHRNLDKFIDQVFTFKVLKITRDKGNIVLSRRAVLMSERDELRSETLKVLQEGVVMEGIVKNVTDYGAFIDLGGIDGLLHISDVTWGRINHPSERLTVGERIPVVVLKYDKEKERVSLGMKQLTQDPWLSIHERYAIGSRGVGKVLSVSDQGVLVELENGVDGFIYPADLSWTKKVRHPSKIVSEGATIEAAVLAIEEDQRRVRLGLKQLQPNPWTELSNLHPIGSKIKGKVRSITDFGIFIEVEEGIDGLVHVSDFSWTKRIKDPKEIQEMFSKGQEVEAVILDIDADNERLSLGIKQLSPDPWEAIPQRYPVGSKVKGTVTSITEFGIFVEIESGIEGLIHTSQTGLEKGEDLAEKFPVGSPIDSEVINIDREERRISLSIRAIKRRQDKESQMGEFIEESSGVVTFGDLIREKLDSGER